MPLRKQDKEFRLPKVSYIDFTHLEMDRVLTALFARLQHNGLSSRLTRKFELTLEKFTAEFLEYPQFFSDFEKYPKIVELWIETHLMDVVNRGKAGQAIAAPRPLHGYTYRFRNPKHSRDYNASQHLYETLYHAREGHGTKALEHLKRFFFSGIDPNTGELSVDASVDVETQALLRLTQQVKDAPEGLERESFQPLCIGSTDLMAEDIIRLLAYQDFIPRSVMVEYLKILISFHLALYHLRLMKLLPALVKRKGGDSTCLPNRCPVAPQKNLGTHGCCPYRLGILVDVTNDPDSDMAALATTAAEGTYRRIPAFLKSYFIAKKLDEFASFLVRTRKLSKPERGYFTVGEALELLGPLHDGERDQFFGSRLAMLIEESTDHGELDPQIAEIIDLGLGKFDTYIEIICSLRGGFHRSAMVRCLDSLMLKNRPGALLAQPGGQKSQRRFVMDSRLLEVLLQVSVLQPGGYLGYHTKSIRIEELITMMKDRYGLYLTEFPANGAFSEPTISDRQALRENEKALKRRLREIGFYKDLSDAFVTQVISPRYPIDKEHPAGGAS
jgi:hypothetical protein